ncbi:adenosylcobinamide-GDP ribazoletransferase [uncultured Litoreibacter sp.]|uniref:adenosylcobinamide-GDP ribazoletransferase n=1 Tax=uncultured Litoreibacter sp. TaxID=1392394 RepID=UPI0026210501|nr:adenosylcobinamide-GDP ribazoletransferase [uncultured Litoreibacter sp.]
MPLPSPNTLYNDLLKALSLLTRLPVPEADWSDEDRAPAKAAWAYPLVGLVIGGLGTIVGLICYIMQLDLWVSAALMIAAVAVATGAMHEDGLADCADGFWGGWEKARRLEIMKDSAIGTYGVLALISVFVVKWASLAALIALAYMPYWIIVIPAVMSRAAMVVAMELLPNSRPDGLSSSTGKPGKRAMWVALGLAAIAAVLAPINAFTLLVVMGLATTTICAIAHKKIGGKTGDVLGACQTLTEAALLVALSAGALQY